MKETAKDWDAETFATRTVSLLIYDEGNLNKYQRTLELVFRVHEGVITDRAASQVNDSPNDTVDALVQAEAFIRGFEDDEVQEGIPDILAGLRAAIARERAGPDMLAALKVANNAIYELASTAGDDARFNRGGIAFEATEQADAAIATAEGRATDPRASFIEMIARMSASGDKVDLDGEEWPDGYEHDTGNSLDALDELIHKARAMTGIKPPELRTIFDWSGPEEGDTVDLSVWITTEFGDEIAEVKSGNLDRNKEIAAEIVAKLNAMPVPLEDGIVNKLIADAIAAEGRANG
jgi:hypothetical protein